MMLGGTGSLQQGDMADVRKGFSVEFDYAAARNGFEPRRFWIGAACDDRRVADAD